MKAVGLIVEYNPFHNGHLHHLQQAKKISNRDAVIAVMSGHFLQRGEPALLDKWTRAEMALAGGCDLVLELPVAYATSSAEWFAYGAIASLEATGVVDSICFGTESGQLEPLQRAAKVVAANSESLQLELSNQLQAGISYPRAFSHALQSVLQQDQAWKLAPIELAKPNHTLGLHYLVALERLKSSMTPYTIPRKQAQYHDDTLLHSTIASATALRKLLQEGQPLTSISQYVPESTFTILERQLTGKQANGMGWENFATTLFYQLAVQPPQQLTQYREIEEGLEHRILHCASKIEHYSVSELIALLKTKRYTHTKLQRALLAVLLQHNKELFSRAKLSKGITYLRVLGFTDKGQQLLKNMKKKAELPIIHSAARLKETSAYLQLDIAATSIYMQMQAPHSPQARLADFHRSPIRISDNGRSK